MENNSSHVLEKFYDELSCFICKGLLQDPMLTKECFHRFCAKCIQREIENGLSHCPTCNRLLPKKMPFKSDLNFASIINKLTLQNKKLNKRTFTQVMKDDGIDIETYKKLNLKDNAEFSFLNESTSSLPQQNDNNKKLKSFNDSINNESFSKDDDTLNSSKILFPLNALTIEKQRLRKGLSLEVILWPDASVFKQFDLPKCLLLPRYIYAPLETTVAHLIEYLFIRINIEDNFKDRTKYNVEIAIVEVERDEFSLIMSPSKKLQYLNMSENNKLTGDCTLVMRNNNEAPNIMHAISHPFKKLDLNCNLSNLSSSFYRINTKQSLKFVYRFIEKK